METAIAVGGCVEHRAYGTGTVLGIGERKEAIRIRFDRAGVKQLPYPSSELAPASSPEGDKGGIVLCMRFVGTSMDGQGCRWVLPIPTAAVYSLVRVMQAWTTHKTKLTGASVDIRAIEKRKLELRIKGHGRDGRCRWCRTFRSGLRTAILRGYGSKAFVLDGACKFDRGKR
jgi:hypothetical protein